MNLSEIVSEAINEKWKEMESDIEYINFHYQNAELFEIMKDKNKEDRDIRTYDCVQHIIGGTRVYCKCNELGCEKGIEILKYLKDNKKYKN